MNRISNAIKFRDKLFQLLNNADIKNSKGRKAHIFITKLTRFYDIEIAPVICIIKSNLSGGLENPDQLYFQIPNMLELNIQIADFSDIDLQDADYEVDYLINQVIDIILENITEFSDCISGLTVNSIDFDEEKTEGGIFWSICNIKLFCQII